MFYFHNDYNEACHPAVLEKIQQNMGKQMGGYSEDTACEKAAAMIRQVCGNENLAVHFLVGGTQTNLIVIAAALRPHQAALGADTAHINVHETGAIMQMRPLNTHLSRSLYTSQILRNWVLSIPWLNWKISMQHVKSTICIYLWTVHVWVMAWQLKVMMWALRILPD